MRMLDFDFFEILDAVTIARSRQHIENIITSRKSAIFPSGCRP